MFVHFSCATGLNSIDLGRHFMLCMLVVGSMWVVALAEIAILASPSIQSKLSFAHERVTHERCYRRSWPSLIPSLSRSCIWSNACKAMLTMEEDDFTN